MGCDIHAHLELKINDKWEHYAEIHIDRNYELFARMANVRNSDGTIQPISTPRGWPEQPAFMTTFCYEDMRSDAHSLSWLSLTELVGLRQWEVDNGYRRKDGMFRYFVLGNYIEDLLEYRPEVVQDARLIFWFDN